MARVPFHPGEASTKLCGTWWTRCRKAEKTWKNCTKRPLSLKGWKGEAEKKRNMIMITNYRLMCAKMKKAKGGRETGRDPIGTVAWLRQALCFYSFASYCMKILAICELTCHTVWVSLRSGGCTSTRRCQWKGGATYQHHTGTYAREIFIVLTLHKIRYSVQCRHMFFKNNDLQFIAIPYISILYCKLMQDSMHLQSTPPLSSTFCNVLYSGYLCTLLRHGKTWLGSRCSDVDSVWLQFL